jgi:DNA mismatch repair protein MSH4
MIEGRLNAVEELTLKTDQLFAIRESLKTFPDLDQVCSAINHIPSKATIKHAEQSINHVLAMKQALLKILAIRPLIQDFDSTLFQTIQHVLNDDKIDELLSTVESVINEDVTYQTSAIGLRHQRCFAVKSGFNGLLDVARQTYKETTDDVHDLITYYSEKYQIPLKTNYEASTGFSISIPVDVLGDQTLPVEFINVVKKRKNFSFTTLKLVRVCR